MTVRTTTLATHDDPMPSAEFDALLKRALAELDGEEGEHLAELITWHCRRYPTPLERLRHASRMVRQWTRAPKIPRDAIR